MASNSAVYVDATAGIRRYGDVQEQVKVHNSYLVGQLPE